MHENSYPLATIRRTGSGMAPKEYKFGRDMHPVACPRGCGSRLLDYNDVWLLCGRCDWLTSRESVSREVPKPESKPPHTYCGLCSNPLGGAWYMDLETPGHIVIPAMCISCRAHLFTRQGLTSTVDELSTRAGCPCELVAPCSEHCSCANGVMSGGCSRCCRYGSDEQQLAAAARLADLSGEVERYRAGVEGLKKMAHCEAHETVAALGLIRLAAREILLGVGLIEHDSGEGS